MQVACWVTEPTDTHSEYVMLIAFPRQQWLDKCASISLYMHCLSCLKDFNNHCYNSLNPEMLVMLLFHMASPSVPLIYSAVFAMASTL